MSNRHLARTVAMQTLYEWDFLGKPEGRIHEMLARNGKEATPAFDGDAFAAEIVDGVLAHRDEIDATIVKYAPEWPLEQITIVDRNILRIGVYELTYAERIPSKVAINEAIEIAKAFGGESSGRFVNGVLGAIFRDRTEAGIVKPIDVELKEKERKPEGSATAAVTPAASDDHSS